MYESLAALDTIKINFSTSGSHILNFVLALIMFGIALNIRINQFKKLLLSPKPVVLGLLLQFFVLPLITFLLIVFFNKLITPAVAMGMILVASCPGGNISNFMSSLSKGNTELSVTLTALSTGLAVFLTPLNFGVWGDFYVNFINQQANSMLQPLAIEFMQMFETVFIILGIPLVSGILCTRYLPQFAPKLNKPFQYLSILFFIVLVVIMFSKNWNIFIRHIHLIFIIVLIHNLVALLTGYGVALFFRQSERNRRTLTIETGIQNSGLGLVLLLNPKLFPPDLAIGGMLLITAWWGIWHIVSGLSLSLYWSKRASEAPV
ncbi:MAG: bile acid:sodium symporter family protein [Tannerella sp.]|jgi:BASS family bile acid:Na+ symporter|nr:bile acid:sodium symporter family protein [Tannerella sp.]